MSDICHIMITNNKFTFFSSYFFHGYNIGPARFGLHESLMQIALKLRLISIETNWRTVLSKHIDSFQAPLCYNFTVSLLTESYRRYLNTCPKNTMHYLILKCEAVGEMAFLMSRSWQHNRCSPISFYWFSGISKLDYWRLHLARISLDFYTLKLRSLHVVLWDQNRSKCVCVLLPKGVVFFKLRTPPTSSCFSSHRIINSCVSFVGAIMNSTRGHGREKVRELGEASKKSQQSGTFKVPLKLFPSAKLTLTHSQA